MGRTGAVKHTHQYFKRGDGLWACSGRGEGCTHFLPRNMAPAPAGYKSICWGRECEKEFQLTPYSMRVDEPRCDECEERLEAIDKFREQQMGPEEDAIMRAIKKVNEEALKNRQKKKIEENDDIEVIEPE